MILVTVGAQMPFDRLVDAIDAWAAESGRGDEIFVQIGEGGRIPQHVEWTHFLQPDEFRQRLAEADALVAHAGTGSILCALELGKKVLVMPRHASRGETRNEHQIATAKRFEALGHVLVAWDESELPARLEELLGHESGGSENLSHDASDELLSVLSDFVSR